MRYFLFFILMIFTSSTCYSDDDIIITREGKIMECKVIAISANNVEYRAKIKGKWKDVRNSTRSIFMIKKEKGNVFFFDNEGNQTLVPTVKVDKKDNIIYLNSGEYFPIYNFTIEKDCVTYQLKDKKKAPWHKSMKKDIFLIRYSDGTTNIFCPSKDIGSEVLLEENEERLNEISESLPNTIKIVSGDTQILKKKATANLIFTWDNAHWMEGGLMKKELKEEEYAMYTSHAVKSFMESFNLANEKFKLLTDGAAEYEFKVVVDKIDYFFSIMNIVPGHKFTIYGKIIISDKQGNILCKLDMERYKGSRDFVKWDSYKKMYQNLGEKIAKL